MQPNTPTNRYFETLHVSHQKRKKNTICGLMCAPPVFTMRSFFFFSISINLVIFLFLLFSLFFSIRFEFLINILVTAMVSYFNRKWCNIASQQQKQRIFSSSSFCSHFRLSFLPRTFLLLYYFLFTFNIS